MSEAREHWNRRYAAFAHATEQPSALLTELEAQLPRQGRALDVAGGAGRNALWLAARGLDVTLADVSDRALELAAERAAARGLSLQLERRDLQADGTPCGPWALIVCLNYLDRSLLGALGAELAPGGLLFVAHPTLANLQRHEKPSARFLLEQGELATLAPGLEVLLHDEAFRDDDRHVARLLARRRS